MTTDKNNIAIIGAGVIGVTTAIELQDKGYKVTLIDDNGIAEKCSKGNAGHIATCLAFPLASPELLARVPIMLLDPKGPLTIQWSHFFSLLPWFLRFSLFALNKTRIQNSTEAINQLNQHSLSTWLKLLDKTNLSGFHKSVGQICLYETKNASVVVKRELEKLKPYSVTAQSLGRDELFDLEPAVSTHVKAGIYYSDTSHMIDPEGVVNKLAEHFLSQGGVLIRDKINRLEPVASDWKLYSSSKTYQFDKVVLAAGAWSAKLLAGIGVNIPLETERGYHLMLKGQSPLHRPISSAERNFIMTPLSSGTRLSGTVEFASVDAKANYKRADILMKHTNALIPETEHSEITSKWMGCRPTLPDSLPVIGKIEQLQGLYLSFGHQHLGLTQAAISARLIAQLINDEPTDFDLSAYSALRRF